MKDNYPETPQRLPKPIDEMSDDEFWAIFPERKPYIGKQIGESDLGPIIEVPKGLLREMIEVVEHAEGEQ